MATLTSRLIVALTDRVSGPARGVGAALDRLNRRATRMNTVMVGASGAFGSGMLRGAMAVGASYYGVSKAIGGTVGSAIKFEEAFADVRKVFTGTPGELEKIRHEILSMSKTMPTTATGLSEIFAAAAQANIPTREIAKFSDMVAKVAVAWDTAESETSQSLAEIKTQLKMGVDEIGLFADAINHLSNNTAARAPDLVDFSKRVAANGEMFGFAATESLAFGSAMIAMGGEANVAATSFRNMGRALTKGEGATKRQRTAFQRLGLDSIKTAKAMQKNALSTTLDVLDRIQGLPEWERISIASALFGDEARALMPVIANTNELRRHLGMVGNEATYAGSAYNEYLERAETTGNALQIIGNKIRAVGIGIGDGWLPAIKELGLGLGDVLDTLDQRIGVFDKVSAAMSGLMTGFGYGGTSGLREMMNDIGDVLFGEAFDSEGGYVADERAKQLAKLSNRMRGIGKDLRQFSEDISSANVAGAMTSLGAALSEMSGGMTIAGAIAIGLTGRAMIALGRGALALTFSKAGQIIIMAMAVSTLIKAVKDAGSLGEFVESLKGLDAIEWATIGAGLLFIGTRAMRAVKWFKELARNAPKPPASAPAAPAPAPVPAGGSWMNALGLTAVSAFWANLVQGLGETPGATFEDQVANQRKAREGLERLFGLGGPKESTGRAHLRTNDDGGRGAALDSFLGNDAERGDGFNWKKFFLGAAAEPGFDFRDHMAIDLGGKDAGPAEVNVVGIPEVSIPAPVTTQPGGTQDVRITNPMPAPIINMTINATTNASPAEIGAAARDALSAELNALSRGAYSDGAN